MSTRTPRSRQGQLENNKEKEKRQTNEYCQNAIPCICPQSVLQLYRVVKKSKKMRIRQDCQKWDSVLLFDTRCAYLPKLLPRLCCKCLVHALLRVLSPELLTYVANALRVVRVHRIRALRATHVLILVIQVLRVLNVLLSVGIGVRVVGLLSSTNRLVSGRLPAGTAHVRATTDAAVLARRVCGGWFQSRRKGVCTWVRGQWLTGLTS